VSEKFYHSIGEVLTEFQKRGYVLERKLVAEGNEPNGPALPPQ
jgi:hypothetical protein